MRIVRHIAIVGHMVSRALYGVTVTRQPWDSPLRRKARKLTTQPQPVWLTPAELAQREADREHVRRNAHWRAVVSAWARRANVSSRTRRDRTRAVKAAQHRLSHSERYGLRLMVSDRAREYAALLDAAEAGTVNRDRVTHTAKLATRGLRAKLRHGLTLTPAEQAQLDAVDGVLSMTPGAAAEAVAPLDAAESAAEGYDPAPYRGMVSARETRYSPRGADAPGKRGTASRVSIRDNHAASQEDEYGMAATTVKPLSTYGVSVPAAASSEQAAWLLSTVKLKPTQASYTRRVLTPAAASLLAHVAQADRTAWLLAQPDSSYVTTHGVPVPVLSIHEAHRLRAEAADHGAATLAAAVQADRVALLASVTTHTAADVSA